jgi:ABC-type dipeptide/oligopeptide/nickel transport system ATPase subunit
MIEVESLSVTFWAGRTRIAAVKRVDFVVTKGEAFGLVGESGSGKTTVLRAVAGLVPSKGIIRLGSETVGATRTRESCRLVQMVFQDPYGSLHPRHTVDGILAEPAEIQGLDAIDRRVDRALAEVGLGPEHRFRYPHQLSGGQRQRVAIARALILEPPILLLDEPTSALDVSVQAEILNLLNRLRDERGLTIVLVSHDLAVVATICDHLAVMRQGEVVETLTVGQLSRGTPSHPYTQQLLRASEGYDRAARDRAPVGATGP